ncbi:GAF domain-containing protein [Paenibacillus sp. P26]|nr:GAF domain-containing protein [Paenibacillus sp. P26]
MYWIGRALARGLNTLHEMIRLFAGGQWGDTSYRIQADTNDEFGRLAHIFNQMADDLEKTTASERALNKINEENLWLQNHSTHIYYQLQEADRLDDLGRIFITELSRIVGAQSGAFYVVEASDAGKKLVLAGSYANFGLRAEAEPLVGQGLVGQAAADGKPVVLEDVPADYGKLGSALGKSEPLMLNIQPIIYDGETIGVFELASFRKFTEMEQRLIVQIGDIIGATLNSLLGRVKIEESLRIHQALSEELQSQSEELMSQQHELKASNERLEEQARALKASEEPLQRQQEELEQANEALMRKTAELEEQVKATEDFNRQIEQANASLEKQALELAMASRYKSEFLANMSHEPRTPLNSLLILSQLMKENKEGNLTSKQVEYAETIYSSGSDLLKLIDDVLDLAKVEAGRMELHPERVCLQEIVEPLERAFSPIARTKNIEFKVLVRESVPAELFTDSTRLKQILKNLLSNAFKFTHSGYILLEVGMVNYPEKAVAFSVEDTGIGIPSDKRRLVFEAFQQADGTTSRKYGGTGLGLSISRRLASLLGGTIELDSEEGKGSRFTLYLPLAQEFAPAQPPAARPDAGAPLALAQAGAGMPRLQPACRKRPQGPRNLSRRRWPTTGSGSVRKIRCCSSSRMTQASRAILLEMARDRGFKAVVALQGIRDCSWRRSFSRMRFCWISSCP